MAAGARRPSLHTADELAASTEREHAEGRRAARNLAEANAFLERSGSAKTTVAC